MMKLILLVSFMVLMVSTYPIEYQFETYYPQEFYPVDGSNAAYRIPRSAQPADDDEKKPKQPESSITPHIIRGDDGTTHTGLKYEHTNEKYDISANWDKNIRGPGKGKPTWGISGTYRW